jgi:hypothetical protein
MDRFVIKVDCPKCGKSAEVQAAENDGAAFLRNRWTYIGDKVPGFRVASSLLKTEVYCDDCQLLVWMSEEGWRLAGPTCRSE